jgi:hypothetical protein
MECLCDNRVIYEMPVCMEWNVCVMMMLVMKKKIEIADVSIQLVSVKVNVIGDTLVCYTHLLYTGYRRCGSQICVTNENCPETRNVVIGDSICNNASPIYTNRRCGYETRHQCAQIGDPD